MYEVKYQSVPGIRYVVQAPHKYPILVQHFENQRFDIVYCNL